MKTKLLFTLLFPVCLTSCGVEDRINQSTWEIQRNTCAIERSTDAIYRNLDELEKIQGSQ